MPMTVKAQVRQAEGKGKGVFALQDIPKGKVLWTLQKTQQSIPMPGFPNIGEQLQYTFEELDKLDPEMKKKISHFGFACKKTKKIILLLDGCCFFNHSFNPNSGYISDSDEEVFCALRDIKKGEQIVEDYTQYWVKNEPRFKDFMKENNPKAYEFLQKEILSKLKEKDLQNENKNEKK